MPEVRVEVRPPWAFRLPLANGSDGVLKRRGRAIQRLLHVDGEPVVVGAIQASATNVVFAARADRRDVAEAGIERLRFAVGVDDDLRDFHERFRWDALIGPAVRRDPTRRARRRPVAFEALAWAVTEQLIEFTRAVEIQRQIVRRLGTRCPETGLRDLPAPAVLAAQAPARLESFGLTGGRALALIRAAREIAAGRIDLDGPDHERAWARLRAIPGIGAWTCEVTALYGQGRYDQVPAGDLEFIKLAGPLIHGDPRARATEEEVRELFAPYEEWQGLAALYLGRALELRGRASGRGIAAAA
jgi:3-methyladenine DNA glycosylase/8-oxoguanine DNA glycosylase